jgi:hypothetical protein
VPRATFTGGVDQERTFGVIAVKVTRSPSLLQRAGEVIKSARRRRSFDDLLGTHSQCRGDT